MKMLLVLLAVVMAVSAGAEPRDWLLKSGKTINGNFVSAGSAKMVLLVGATNFVVNLSDLETNEFRFIIKGRIDQRLARYSLAANQLASDGLIEVDAKTIKNFPERTDFKKAWMDVKFDKVDNAQNPYGSVEADLKLTITGTDNNGDRYYHLTIPKKLSDLSTPNAIALQAEQIKKGDKVRFIGVVYSHPSGDFDAFDVNSFEIMETAEEIAFVKSLK